MDSDYSFRKIHNHTHRRFKYIPFHSIVVSTNRRLQTNIHIHSKLTESVQPASASEPASASASSAAQRAAGRSPTRQNRAAGGSAQMGALRGSPLGVVGREAESLFLSGEKGEEEG